MMMMTSAQVVSLCLWLMVTIGVCQVNSMSMDFDLAGRTVILARHPRSLLSGLPFNQRDERHQDTQRLRQGLENVVASAPTTTNAAPGQEEKCVEKVMMTEETVFDDGIECHHSYDKRCHTTYTTDYEPQQVQICDENFVKECYIEYKDIAFNESVEICNERPVRNCDSDGPTVCETVYESECETKNIAHPVEEDVPNCRINMVEKCRDVTQGYETVQQCDKWPMQVCDLERKNVTRYTPETQCKKKPREICGPGPCPITKGPRECRNEMKTIVQEVPEETCNLRAQPFCEHVTKLVPNLKPAENCVDVPKEVCVRVRTNPRKVKKPIIKKWCYVPTKESGLAAPPTLTSSAAGRSNDIIDNNDDDHDNNNNINDDDHDDDDSSISTDPEGDADHNTTLPPVSN